MRTVLLTLTIVPLCLGSALACDDHVGACEIEAWRWYESLGDVVIEGSATCNTGSAQIRLYEESGDDLTFLGIAAGYIEGHALWASVSNVEKPQSLSIKYSIDPGL